LPQDVTARAVQKERIKTNTFFIIL